MPLLRELLALIKHNKYIKYVLYIMLYTVLHFSFASFIAIENVSPDIFLIFVVWLSIKEGRLFGILSGFVIGLYLDFVSGDIMGINALTKTIIAFIAGKFHKKDAIKQIINEYKFIFVVLICSITHNLIYFLFSINISEQSFILYYLRYSLASTLYTTFISTFSYIFQLSRNRIRYYS